MSKNKAWILYSFLAITLVTLYVTLQVVYCLGIAAWALNVIIPLGVFGIVFLILLAGGISE